MKKIFLFVLMFSMLVNISNSQQVGLTGKVINPDEKPIKKVFVYLANNPSLYCYSDSLGNFSLTNISTSVSEVMKDKIISFENRKLSVYANNQSIAVDVFTIDGRQVKNIVNLRYCLGTFGLYPEAYLSDLPEAVYIVRVIVGNTSQSFKIQNLIPTAFPQGITEYDINNIIDTSITELKSEPDKDTKSDPLDTLVLVHDFYKSRKIPLNSYTIQYDTIHLNNFSDYSIAEGFEPALTYLESGYGAFTNIHSEGDIQFIIDYDTLSILNDDLKLITIPVRQIESLDNSIKFISGLHLEPSGTEFLQPVQVTVLLKDSIPKNLVVFQCDDKGKTHYLPYITRLLTGSSYYYSIVFIINHFSSVGIGTGQINRDSDPSKFTTTEQFETYAASYSPDFDELPPDFWSYWFNNVVAPKITGIITWEDFKEAFGEFSLICKEWQRLYELGAPPFHAQADAMFCEKVLRIWNNCKEEYDRLEDKCLKREIFKITANLFELSILTAGEGSFCPGFSLGNINDLGNGEISNLVNEIEFLKTVKHLEIEGTYLIEYNLKTISGNPPIPEVINWSSSNPSIASVNENGRVYAIKPGEATVTGRICDITNSIKIEVGGGVNCEKDYCINKYDSCYSGRYMCTGVLSYSKENDDYYCPHISYLSRLTIVGSLDPGPFGYYDKIVSITHEDWDPDLKTCITGYCLATSHEGGDFECRAFSYSSEEKNFFVFLPSHFHEESFKGYFNKKEKELTIYVKLGTKTTKMQCVINK
jgi:hypothetical protein